MTTPATIVYHHVGSRTPTNALHPVTAERMYEQRCTRCGTVLDHSPSPLLRYAVGDEIERLEARTADGVVVVKYTAIPLYDIEQRYRQRGVPVPYCTEARP